MSRLTRISSKKSSFIPTGAKFSPPPVLQPKTEIEPDAKLPEWKPGGGGAVSPLQRLLDSKAVQAKLTIGQPGDRYEQEADRVARDVVQRINSPVSETPQQDTVQREPDAASEQLLESPVQRKEDNAGENPSNHTPNRTGLPAQLKAGIENLSGYSLGDVKVHYNSPKPAQLQALAYTKGTDIHVAPGQEQHLPHEAWHVVQQKQGRVKGTKQAKGNESINDDPGLEREADRMGAKALQRISEGGETVKSSKLTTDTIQLRGRLENIEETNKPRLVLKIVLPGSGDDQWRSQTKEDVAHKNEQTFLRTDPVKIADLPMSERESAAFNRGVWDPKRGAYNKGKYGVFTTPKPAYWRRTKANDNNFRHVVRTYPGPGGKGTQDNYTAIGGAADAGSNRIEVNVKNVPKDVFSEVKDFVQDESSLDDYSVIILIKSHSRNAVAGCNIANVIAENYLKNPSVHIELVAYDPVPGPNHWKTMYNDIVLSARIDESTVVYSIDSGYPAGFKPTKVRGAKRYIGTPHKHDAGMANGVLYQGRYYRGSELNELPAGAYVELLSGDDSDLAGSLMPVESKKELEAALPYLTDQKLSTVSKKVGDHDYRRKLIEKLMNEQRSKQTG